MKSLLKQNGTSSMSTSSEWLADTGLSVKDLIGLQQLRFTQGKKVELGVRGKKGSGVSLRRLGMLSFSFSFRGDGKTTSSIPSSLSSSVVSSVVLSIVLSVVPLVASSVALSSLGGGVQ